MTVQTAKSPKISYFPNLHDSSLSFKLTPSKDEEPFQSDIFTNISF